MPADRPHILFVNTDQLRADFLGCYGFPQDTSPNIDQIAREGMLFRNAFTQSPICVPARYSLTTGQYVSGHEAYTNNHAPHPNARSLLPAFSEHGYHTVAIGKLHHNPPDDSFGFAEVLLHDGTFPKRRPFSVYSQWLQEEGVDEDELAYAVDVDEVPEKRRLKDRLHWGRCRLEDEHTESTFLGNLACDYVGRYNQDKPLLLYLSFVAPHSPYCPPAPYDTMFDPADMPCPPRESEADYATKHPKLEALSTQQFGTERIPEATMREIRAQYAGLLRHMDAAIGKAVEAFKARFGENVIVALTSDHGDFLGEHYRCEKHFLYEAATHIPWIIAWPGHIPAGAETDALAEQIDQFPTVLGLIGADGAARGVAGRDRSAGLLAGTPEGGAFVFSENHDIPAFAWSAMARSRAGKLIVWVDKGKEAPLTYEYYDLAADPHELRNVITDAAHAPAVAAHKAALLDWLCTTKRFTVPRGDGFGQYH